MLFIDKYYTLAYINLNYPILLDLKISNKDFWDFNLSEHPKICNCDLFEEPIFCINFNDIYKNCSNDIWIDSISPSKTIKNFGITGYDNRFLPSLDSDLVLDGEKQFCLTAINGENFCYNLLSGSPIQFCGGFFQGFYKIKGEDYQVLPEYFPNGWTAEFYLLKSSCTCDSELPTLNETYPNNDGIFYYYGTRAENKFCSLKEHLLNYEFQSGSTFLQSSIRDQSHIQAPNNINPFLFFNEPTLCEYEQEIEFNLKDCCNDLKYNALAFRITPEGRIGYRYLATSGTCIEKKYQEELKIYEKYSVESNLFSNTVFNLVTIKFAPYEKHDCIPNKQTFGVLSIYVDGYLKLREYDFPNIIPYAFDDLNTKQYGVPFNISVGGGTQGLLEMQVDTPKKYNVCSYKFYLKKNQFLKGFKIDNVEYFTPLEYGYYDRNEIVSFLENIISNKFSKIFTKQTQNYLEFIIDIMVEDFQEIFFSLDIDNDETCCYVNLPSYSQNKPYKFNCFEFTTDNNMCGILEENFAGTFEGFIQSFCLYNKSLSLNEIRCNQKNIYNLL